MNEAEDLMNKCCFSKCRGHALEAENKRLREALENLINDHPGNLHKDKPTTIREAEQALKKVNNR